MDAFKYQCVNLKRRTPGLLLNNGSERGDYVPMSHIFSCFNRIHDGIQLMKTYYPFDPIWSSTKKISEVSHRKVDYAWNYEYENYHPFDILEENSKVIEQFKDIKKFGSDIHLTLTLDLSLSDYDLEKIFKPLLHFGKIYLRLNHEANGYWFIYNNYYQYKEVSDFFVRCHKIVKSTCPNVYTVFSLSADVSQYENHVKNDHLKLADDQMAEALSIADYWSLDKYTSLNFGWPYYDMKEGKFSTGTIEQWWQLLYETYLKMIHKNDMKMKKLFINEFNSDSDVDGEEGQGQIIAKIYERIRKSDFDWLAGITLYQFRDHGGLGLEKGDLKEYKSMPSLLHYKDAIKNMNYELDYDEQDWKYADFIFNWTDSDSIRGLSIKNFAEKKSIENKFDVPFFLIDDKKDWFYLKPGDIHELEGQNGIILCLPPCESKSNSLKYSNTVRDFKNLIESMVV
jgi:hypothetical protein